VYIFETLCEISCTKIEGGGEREEKKGGVILPLANVI
jgi:hypothetical protein